MIYVSCNVQTHFKSFYLARYIKKVLGALSLFLQKKLFAVKFRRVWTFSLCKLYKKVMGAISRFLHPNMKLFAVEFRCILDVFAL